MSGPPLGGLVVVPGPVAIVLIVLIVGALGIAALGYGYRLVQLV